MSVTNEWEPITHRISPGLNNSNGLEWELEFSLFTDDERTAIRGMPIGFMHGGKFVPNKNETDHYYKVLWTTNGKMMFFRKPMKKVK